MNKSTKHLISVATVAGLLLPALVSAQTTVESFLSGTVLGILNAAIRVMVALATLVFIYGVIKYIAAGGDPEATKKARSFIIWSIIGLALIIGIWGVANFLLTGLFGGTVTQGPVIPTIR